MSSITDAFAKMLLEFQRLQASHPCLERWTLSLDTAKRRAGACYPSKKRLTLSRYHLSLNDEHTVKDTLLHEVAHAIAWERFKEPGHGKHWKRIITELGGAPKATGKFSVPEACWVLVYYDRQRKTLKKLAERHRRNRRIGSYMLRGRPDTRGNLYYLSTHDFKRWQQKPDVIHELAFHQ